MSRTRGSEGGGHTVLRTIVAQRSEMLRSRRDGAVHGVREDVDEGVEGQQADAAQAEVGRHLLDG